MRFLVSEVPLYRCGCARVGALFCGWVSRGQGGGVQGLGVDCGWGEPRNSAWDARGFCWAAGDRRQPHAQQRIRSDWCTQSFRCTLETALFCISFLRKGEVLAYVGCIHNLKDLKETVTPVRSDCVLATIACAPADCFHWGASPKRRASRRGVLPGVLAALQGYLTYKKTHRPRTLQ